MVRSISAYGGNRGVIGHGHCSIWQNVLQNYGFGALGDRDRGLADREIAAAFIRDSKGETAYLRGDSGDGTVRVQAKARGRVPACYRKIVAEWRATASDIEYARLAGRVIKLTVHDWQEQQNYNQKNDGFDAEVDQPVPSLSKGTRSRVVAGHGESTFSFAARSCSSSN